MARIPFGGSFIEKGFRVNGTTTSNKISKLEKAGIHPFLFQSKWMLLVRSNFLKDSSILIIDIPPKRRTNKENFV
jgi:hypothetical protein